MILGVGTNRNQIPCWQAPNLPAPTITTSDQKQGASGWILVDDKSERERELNKPPYCVPSMDEIRAIKPNGYKVASTFSGAGGSCTGYRMAGYTVVWANEFVPAAQESYKANAAPSSILDGRDIKQVTAGDILKAAKLKPGELDLFDGSPPCQAFSTAGKREKGWGKDKTYEHGAKQKNETLFDEYIRLVDGLQPKVFVAENVSGLVKGVAKGFFLEILAALKACGYNVKAKLLDAQWLGVPQMRQRIIFIGVRNDLKLEPVFPSPLPYRYSVRDALPWITTIGSSDGYGESHQVPSDRPYHTVATAPQQGNGLARFVEARVIHDTGGNSPNRWAANVDITDKPAPAITNGVNGLNSSHFKVETRIEIDPGSKAKGRVVGKVINQQESMPTITAHGVAGGNPAQVVSQNEKRKFTIAELKRICAFPDDFILTGSYAQQWERLGNSVPPVMMSYIAKTIQIEILDRLPHAKQKARK